MAKLLPAGSHIAAEHWQRLNGSRLGTSTEELSLPLVLCGLVSISCRMSEVGPRFVVHERVLEQCSPDSAA